MGRGRGGCRRLGRRWRARVSWRVRCPRRRCRACAPTDGSPPENCNTKLRTDLVGQPDEAIPTREVPSPRFSSSDAAGRRRSPTTLPGFRAGRPPRNQGFRYPPDPPRVEEIIAVMRRAGETDHGLRLRALIVVLWREAQRPAAARPMALATNARRAEYVLGPRRGPRSRGALRVEAAPRPFVRLHHVSIPSRPRSDRAARRVLSRPCPCDHIRPRLGSHPDRRRRTRSSPPRPCRRSALRAATEW